jgi:large subunit ribosomal protein L4
MPKLKVYNVQGNVVGEHELTKAFAVKVNPALVHEVVTAINANARSPWAHTKTKGEVSGSGKKPWKQKGTGRARQGSHRSPQWVGGGIVFGPRSERDYSQKINRKTKALVLQMTLSDKVANDKMVLLDEFVSAKGKTKESVAAIKKLPAAGRVAVVTEGSDALLLRSLRNVPDVHITNLNSLSIMDVMGADVVIMTVAAAKKLDAKKA